MKMILVLVAGMLLLSGVAQAGGQVIRATDMGTTMWSDLAQGKLDNTVVEFRRGDELPVSFEAQGDLIETKQASVSYVAVKSNFWLRLSHNQIEISLDGTSFKKLNEVLTGSIEAGASSDQNHGAVNSINILFKAFLK